jgi:hypothetical protein
MRGTNCANDGSRVKQMLEGPFGRRIKRMPNINDYHYSINNEFKNLRDRARNLVQNWSEDGRYKEAIFKNIIKRYLPGNFSVGTGFVISRDDGIIKQTNQIDVIIYNNLFPTFFQEGDFVILTPECVHGIIEIKTRLNNENFTDVVTKCNSNGKFIHDRSPGDIFNGLFFFDDGSTITRGTKQTLIDQREQNLIQERRNYLVNHIAIGDNNFIKYNIGNNDRYGHYVLTNLAYSYFIMNIIESIVWAGAIPQNRLWFPEDKEIYLQENF